MRNYALKLQNVYIIIVYFVKKLRAMSHRVDYSQYFLQKKFQQNVCNAQLISRIMLSHVDDVNNGDARQWNVQVLTRNIFIHLGYSLSNLRNIGCLIPSKVVLPRVSLILHAVTESRDWIR